MPDPARKGTKKGAREPAPTILVVEDDPDARELVELAVVRSGLGMAQYALDGAEALKVLGLDKPSRPGKSRSPPSLVILDLDLPKVQGLQVLRRIRADPRYQSLPVVVYTSTGLHSRKDEATEAGASDYVPKPVDFAKFLAAVEAICRRWLGP